MSKKHMKRTELLELIPSIRGERLRKADTMSAAGKIEIMRLIIDKDPM